MGKLSSKRTSRLDSHKAKGDGKGQQKSALNHFIFLKFVWGNTYNNNELFELLQSLWAFSSLPASHPIWVLSTELPAPSE